MSAGHRQLLDDRSAASARRRDLVLAVIATLCLAASSSVAIAAIVLGPV